MRRGSVVFLLKINSILSLKPLWKSYKDGSLKESIKKAMNEMEELKTVSNGDEIDVAVTIDEEEYREVYWNLILSEMRENSVSEQNSTKDVVKQRRHSMYCGQDAPKLGNELTGVTKIQIQAGRHVAELDQVLNNLKFVKAKKEANKDKGREVDEVVSIVEHEEERLREIRQELSEINIVLTASGLIKMRIEEGQKAANVFPNKEKTEVHQEACKKEKPVCQEDTVQPQEAKSIEHSTSKMNKDQQLLLEQRLPNFQDDVIATELFDNLPCLTDDQKDAIAYDEKNYLPSKGVRTLVEKLEEHEEGFEQFVNALHKADLGHVASLLDVSFADVPIIVRISEKYRKRQMLLEKQIALKFSKSSSKENKKLRQEFEKVLPKGLHFVHTKLVETSEGRDANVPLPKDLENSLAVVFRASKIEVFDSLWKMHKEIQLKKIFQEVLLPVISNEEQSRERSPQMFTLEASLRKEDYDISCERIGQESVSVDSALFNPFLKEQLDDEGFKNWVKVGCALDLISKEFLQPFIEREAKAFHASLIAKLHGLPPCPCTHTPGREPNPYHDMGSCNWAKELESHHTERRPTWSQSDGSLWTDPNVGYWEIAKLFMPPNFPLAKDEKKVGASETTVSLLLDILLTCNHFKITKAKVKEFGSIVSTWKDAIGRGIDSDETNRAFKRMRSFLEDRELSAEEYAIKALKKFNLLATDSRFVSKTVHS